MSMAENLSEHFRIAARDFCEKEAAANLLEQTKSSVLAQLMTKQGDIPVNRAEQIVKAGEDWQAFIASMVEARKVANVAKLKLEYIRMLFSERQSAEANARAERRM